MLGPENETPADRRSDGDELDLNLERIAGFDVYDRNDEHIGSVSGIWTDRTGQPAYLGVKTLWLIGRTHVVPAHHAQVNAQEERVRIPYLKEEVRNAPSFDPDAELDFDKEQEVWSYYRGRGPGLPDLQPKEGTQAPTGAVPPVVSPTDRPEAGVSRTETGETTAIPLHEEEIHVGKRQVETAGIRLRKVVRTEVVSQPVELKREDVVIERVPASESTQETGGRQFEGESIYIPLRREEAVIDKETRVREEVRARKTQGTERQNITGQVRKEDIEVEKEDERHHVE